MNANGKPNIRPELIDVSQPLRISVEITPGLAERWLQLNKGNRRVRGALIEYLLSQIRGGEWQADHPQPIIFSDAGRLIDGQHRLRAIVKSNRSVVARVEFGAPDKLREYIDTGTSRSLDDRLCLIAENHESNLTACQIVTGMFRMLNNAKRPSPEEARDKFLLHREAINWMARTRNKRHAKGVDRVWVLIALTEAWEKNREKTESFYASLISVDGPVQPARVLRDWLRGVQKQHGNTFDREIYGKSVAAIKAHFEGREIKTLRATGW